MAAVLLFVLAAVLVFELLHLVVLMPHRYLYVQSWCLPPLGPGDEKAGNREGLEWASDL